MKKFFFLTVILFIGCSSLLSATENNKEVKIINIDGKNYWSTDGYSRSVNLQIAIDDAALVARTKIARYLAKSSGDSFKYDLRMSFIQRQEITIIGYYYVVTLIVAAPCNENPKK